MVDRLSLLEQLLPLADMDTAAREGVRKGLDAALSACLPKVPLELARKQPPNLKSELDLVLRDGLDAKSLLALAARWEPARSPLDATQKATLRADLSALLEAIRHPYAAVSIMLSDAKALSDDERRVLCATIERFAPNADLKKLWGLWDKHLKPVPAARAARAAHLVELLNGAEPAPPPPAAPRRSSRPRTPHKT